MVSRELTKKAQSVIIRDTEHKPPSSQLSIIMPVRQQILYSVSEARFGLSASTSLFLLRVFPNVSSCVPRERLKLWPRSALRCLRPKINQYFIYISPSNMSESKGWRRRWGFIRPSVKRLLLLSGADAAIFAAEIMHNHTIRIPGKCTEREPQERRFISIIIICSSKKH